ncbi:apolipoprotein N-acyltransferase [Pseudidiomarina donghaiensis]|uniref:Apolipoprotein N-acyltransferase n=1 Tax=Pseudidiomarina donghaiensis TaxID=519452 RepID=A0A432XLG9_9GAMM|nr:apolipoprotein N-acyltransferase [Pseudidiomarina donghaiensis]RUO49553.1 apolipoprotein N-acyltransferase [Pseudidiomarina donghaiensis]SFV21481.1 apolipoprotein N-acyltransferase [Pseudidiomarina donghaiensis]
MNNKTRLAALLLGGSLIFSYAPFQQAWLVLPVLVGLLWLTRHASPGAAWRIGYYFGLGWFSAGLSWIYVSIDQFGGLPVPASVGVLAALFLYLSLFPALALYLWKYTERWLGSAAIAMLPLTWLIAESLRGWLFTGFPWLELGYTQTDSWLGNYAPWLGGSGITTVLWAIAICLVVWAQQRQKRFGLTAFVLLVVPFALPWLSPIHNTGEQARVLLVQGNIEQSIKWNPDQHWQSLMTYLDLSRPHYDSHDIIVWPESAVTMPEPYTDDVLTNIHNALVATDTTLITGIIDYQNREYFNTMIVLGQDAPHNIIEPYAHGHTNRYQKHQLLPIGEFVPFEDLLRPLAPLFDLPMSSFSRGDYQQANLRANGFQLAGAICYEIAFPEQVRDNVQTSTDYILTVSNDTWFGASHGPAQHMQIARMRALELGRPLLRATNNGISAVVDAFGNELGRAPQFTATALSTKVDVVTGQTLYHKIGSLGAWLFAGFIALIGLLLRLASYFPNFGVVKRKQNQ